MEEIERKRKAENQEFEKEVQLREALSQKVLLMNSLTERNTTFYSLPRGIEKTACKEIYKGKS